MDLLPPFLQTVSQYYLLNPTTKVLVAVSGGLDSVVLCDLCKKGGLQFTIAHCNFGLRGEESERDESFVRSLGVKYEVEVLVKGFTTQHHAEETKLSIQEAARNLRYAWFEEVRKGGGFAYTLLAHHANDNMETVLMNFFRGTGLEGLTGMPMHNKEAANCLRPLLKIRRREIEAYAKEASLQWVEDSSNSSSKYTRNFFRNELLPQIKKVYPQAEENVLNTIKRLQQTATIYNESISGLKKKICEIKADEIHIPVLKLMKYKDTSLIYEIIKDYGFGEGAIEEIIKLADADSGKYVANNDYRIIRHRKWFIISPTALHGNTIVIDKEDGEVRFVAGIISIKKITKEKFKPDTSSLVAQLDASQIDYPLILRPWKTGDYFYPLGMRKKKKLSRFFIDNKLSKTEKEKVWVIESHKRIIWVVNYRIDDRFKITSTITEILQLSVSSL
jgi:tRNA(Ile)-lysidine synthase